MPFLHSVGAKDSVAITMGPRLRDSSVKPYLSSYRDGTPYLSAHVNMFICVTTRIEPITFHTDDVILKKITVFIQSLLYYTFTYNLNS